LTPDELLNEYKSEEDGYDKMKWTKGDGNNMETEEIKFDINSK
jgi:hypothetical protein